jgi:hypothetical protein
MSALSKILTKSITKVIKNLTKFEVAIDGMIDKFKDSCPSKAELLAIVKQKNQIQSALENVIGAFNTVEATAQTTQTIVSTVSGAVKIIKSIPVPTSFPPGAGIPINVITLLADSLDTLGDLLKGAKGALKVVPSAGKTITEAASVVLTKLQQLDIVLNKCIEELAEGMTQSEKNDLINEIGNVAAEAGVSVNIGANVANEEELLSRLNPNSIDPFLYQRQPTIFVIAKDENNDGIADETGQALVKGEGGGASGYYAGSDWKLTIEYDPDNTLGFPRRRIRCVNINEDSQNIFKGITLWNAGGQVWNREDKGYSYSTSVKVLIDEAKFKIDSLNVGYWNSQLIQRNIEEYVEENRGAQDDGGGDDQPPTTTTTTTTNNPPPQPIELSLTPQQSLEDLEIKLPVVTLGNPQSNNYFDASRQVGITVLVPSSSLKFEIDTGGNTIYSEFYQGDFNQGEFGSYIHGEVELRVDTNYGSPDNEVIYINADRELKQRTIYYPSIGNYTLKYSVESQNEIQFNQGGVIKLDTTI